MADIKYYDVILKPVITEKSMNAMGEKKYTFLVHPEANKSQIKEAVEKMFEGTKVKSYDRFFGFSCFSNNCSTALRRQSAGLRVDAPVGDEDVRVGGYVRPCRCGWRTCRRSRWP